MKLISIDLEWNCALNIQYYYKDKISRRKKRKPLPSTDIIDFGVSYICDIDEINIFRNYTINNLNEHLANNSYTSIVKPLIWKKLNSRVAKLTGYKSKILQEKGVPFPDVWNKFLINIGFRDNIEDEIVFCSWTLSDATVLASEFMSYGLDKYINTKIFFIDIQKLYLSLFSGNIKKNISLENALKSTSYQTELNIDLDLHKAIEDAKSLTYIFHFILQKYPNFKLSKWIKNNKVSLKVMHTKMLDRLEKKRLKIKKLILKSSNS